MTKKEREQDREGIAKKEWGLIELSNSVLGAHLITHSLTYSLILPLQIRINEIATVFSTIF